MRRRLCRCREAGARDKEPGFRKFLEKLSIGHELWILRPHQRVEFFDADQGVLIGGITMKKLVLHQAGEVTELRKVTAEEIHSCIIRSVRPTSPFCARMPLNISRGRFAYRKSGSQRANDG